MIKKLIIFLAFLTYSHYVFAQEYVVPLDHNIQKIKQPDGRNLAKITANTLPFFEDFTDYTIFPDITKWTDHSVYLNNTMGKEIFSRGVATFDALNALGGPYDSVNNLSLLYADSLTSQPFDLSIYQPSDSLYLSFFYQPQGNGFAPETQDSLMLYFKKRNSVWKQIWAKEGTTYLPFTQVMIAVNDTAYLHSGFQFRFVNKASANINDDVWNVDYIRFEANRTMNDTAVNDVATTVPASNMLNDYTAMPYRHFTANQGNELSAQQTFTARNNSNALQAVLSGYIAKETTTNTNLSSTSTSSGNQAPYFDQSYQFPMYNINFTAGEYDKVIFENTYFASTTFSSPKANDTIVHEQVFDNYFAYDDGTAEKSYFLKQSTTLPAKLAIEYHLNKADTLRGFAVYFGRQVPLASDKFFNVEVFSDIAFNGGTDQKIYEEQLFFPYYADTVNHFWTYTFTDPVPVSSGALYLSLMQPASSGSDSLYYGLDVNRVGSNHAYYNVLGVWESSTVSGAIMIRPLLGQAIIGTSVNETTQTSPNFTIAPNPASDRITILTSENKNYDYQITDIQGRVLLQGAINNEPIAIQSLTAGIYFIRLTDKKQISKPQKFIKL